MLAPRIHRAVALGPGPPRLTSTTFGVGSYPGDGGGYLRVVFGISNPIGGEYVEVEYNVSAGDPITTTGPGGPVGPYAASPADVPVGLGAAPSASATVRLYSSVAVLLHTVVVPDQPLPI